MNIKAESLVPHRNTMLLIRKLNEYSEDHARGKTMFTSEDLFINHDGRLLGTAYIEMIAQLTAAHQGYKCSREKISPKLGFLVGINDFEIMEQTFINSELQLYIKRGLQLDQINVIDGIVRCNDIVIATGSIRIWEVEKTSATTLYKPSKPSIVKEPKKKYYTKFSPEKRGILRKALVECLYVLNLAERGEEHFGLYYCDRGFIGFEGHFPEIPILSGVIMLEMGLVLCEEILEVPIILKSIKKIKYSGIVFPDEPIEARISLLKEKDDNHTAKMNLIKEGKPVAKLEFSFMKTE